MCLDSLTCYSKNPRPQRCKPDRVACLWRMECSFSSVRVDLICCTSRLPSQCSLIGPREIIMRWNMSDLSPWSNFCARTSYKGWIFPKQDIFLQLTGVFISSMPTGCEMIIKKEHKKEKPEGNQTEMHNYRKRITLFKNLFVTEWDFNTLFRELPPVCFVPDPTVMWFTLTLKADNHLAGLWCWTWCS